MGKEAKHSFKKPISLVSFKKCQFALPIRNSYTKKGFKRRITILFPELHLGLVTDRYAVPWWFPIKIVSSKPVVNLQQFYGDRHLSEPDTQYGLGWSWIQGYTQLAIAISEEIFVAEFTKLSNLCEFSLYITKFSYFPFNLFFNHGILLLLLLLLSHICIAFSTPLKIWFISLQMLFKYCKIFIL